MSRSVVPLVMMILTGCASLDRGAGAPAARLLGGETELGKGTVSAYAEENPRGEPTAIGVVFSAAALEGLPPGGSDFHHCVDRNKDGIVDRMTECIHTYVRRRSHLLRRDGDAGVPDEHTQHMFPDQVTAGGRAERLLPDAILPPTRGAGRRVRRVDGDIRLPGGTAAGHTVAALTRQADGASRLNIHA